MVIVKIHGGLGNQLFQYAIGRAVSLRLNCDLALDTSFYPQQTFRKYELDKLNIQARIATKEEIMHAGGGRGFFQRVIRKLLLTKIMYPNYLSELQSISYVDAIDSCQLGSYLDGYWQNPRYFEDYKYQLQDDFKPIKSISDLAQGWLLKIENTNSVSLHVRRGDYVTDPHTNSMHGVCSLEYYQRAIEIIKKSTLEPNFYIFSDDISWCKDNFAFLGNCFFVDDTETAIDDFVLMTQCNHSIIANSTFSWWGAWLGSKGAVIAPKKWFPSATRSVDSLFPRDWLQE